MRLGFAVFVAVVVAATTAGLLSRDGAPQAWSADPFPVSGWIVELIGPGGCETADGVTDCETIAERLARAPCVQRFAHDHPEWTAEGCGTRSSFVDGVFRLVVGVGPEQEVHEDDLGGDVLHPNPWFAPAFAAWQGRTVRAGALTLYAREPTRAEVAAALDLSGLPDPELAAALVSPDRLERPDERSDGTADQSLLTCRRRAGGTLRARSTSLRRAGQGRLPRDLRGQRKPGPPRRPYAHAAGTTSRGSP